MSDIKSLSFGGQSLPFDIGAIVDDDGVCLTLAPIQFDFSYHGIRFACRSEPSPEGNRLRLVGDAGPMPFTAESPAARAAIQAILDHANATLAPPQVFRCAQGRILVGAERPLPQPITAVALVAALTRVLAPIHPWLALLSEVVRPPLLPAKPGEGALRSGWRRRPVTGR